MYILKTEMCKVYFTEIKVLRNVETTNIFRYNCTSGYEGRVCENSIDECRNNKYI